MADSTNTSQSVLRPSDITTVGTGDGTETSTYNEPFSLLSADGSGNPTDESQANQKSYYNKDLDLVQNMRNCFAVVSQFKEQVDSIVLASGYGGWTIITENVDMTVFVMRANRVDKKVLPEIENLYKSGKYQHMTMILNCVDIQFKKYGYGKSSYGYGYGNSQ